MPGLHRVAPRCPGTGRAGCDRDDTNKLAPAGRRLIADHTRTGATGSRRARAPGGEAVSTASLYTEPDMTMERAIGVIDDALARDSHFHVYSNGTDKVEPMLALRQA